jgi:hypothetical protein
MSAMTANAGGTIGNDVDGADIAAVLGVVA